MQSKDAFRFVNFVPENVYSALVWYNRTNFTGHRVWSDDAEAAQQVWAAAPR